MKYLLFFTSFLVFVSCIKTQQDIRMEEEMTRIKTEQQSLKSEIKKGNIKEFNKDETIDDLKTEIQMLSGKIEEVAFKNEKNMNEKLSVQEREIEAMKKEIAELRSEIKGSKPSPEVQQGIEKLSEKQLYNVAIKKYKDAQYREAASDLEVLLNKFPKTTYRENAHFFIAESNFKLGKFEDAIIAYEDVYKKFPKSKHLAQVNLKQGICFMKIGSNADSKFFLNEVIKNYPNSSEAKEAQKELQKLTKSSKPQGKAKKKAQ